MLGKKKHEKEQWKGGLSWWAKATEAIKNWFSFSLSLPHGNPLPWITARLSVHVAHMVPWLNCEPWTVHPAWDKELHLVTVLPAKTSKLCSPSMDNEGGCKGAGVFPTKGNKWGYFHQKRHKDNTFSVCLIHMKAYERHSVSPFALVSPSARSESMSLHFASWFPFWGMFKLFVKEKKCTICLASLNPKWILRPILHWPHLAQDETVERVDTGLLA